MSSEAISQITVGSSLSDYDLSARLTNTRIPEEVI